MVVTKGCAAHRPGPDLHKGDGPLGGASAPAPAPAAVQRTQSNTTSVDGTRTRDAGSPMAGPKSPPEVGKPNRPPTPAASSHLTPRFGYWRGPTVCRRRQNAMGSKRPGSPRQGGSGRLAARHGHQALCGPAAPTTPKPRAVYPTKRRRARAPGGPGRPDRRQLCRDPMEAPKTPKPQLHWE